MHLGTAKTQLRRLLRQSQQSASENEGGETSKPPIWLHFRASKGFLLWTCAFSIFTDVFLYGLIVPVVPFALTDRIGIDEKDVQEWTSILLTVYSVSLLIGSPICGWIGDRTTTRQLPFLVGLVVLGGATLMLALAKSIAVMVAARVLQGLSAALVWTVALAMVTDRVGSKSLGTSMGAIVAAKAIGLGASPLLGGIVYAKAGYYPVYALAFAFLGADIVFRFIMIEARTAMKWDPSLGPETDFDGTPANPDEADKGPQAEDNGGEIVQHGRLYRLMHRLPPVVTMLGSTRLLVALWGFCVYAILYSVFDAVLPVFVKRTFHWDAVGAGLIFLAVVVPSLISPLIGRLSDKHGPRWYCAVGFLLTMIPFVLLRIVNDNSLHDKIVCCALLAFTGGLSMLFEIPIQVDMIIAVEKKMKKNPKHYGDKGAYAQTFGLSNLTFALGMIVGPLWGGFVYERAGWGTMTLSLGVVIGASAIPTAIWTGGNIFRKARRKRYQQNAPAVEQGASVELTERKPDGISHEIA